MFADHEARATLGAILLTGQRALEPVQAEAGLQPHHFYKPSHQHIYAAAVHLADQGDGIDQLTIASELRRRGQLDTVGEDIVDALLADAPVASNVVTYARAVVEAARWRARDDLHRRALTAVEAGDEAAYNATTAVTAEPDRGQAYTADMMLAQFEQELTDPGNVIPTPWDELTDGFSGGVDPGDTTIISGHSSHGKSIVSMAWLEHVANLPGQPRVGLYTNEMSVSSIRDRFVAGTTADQGVPFARLLAKKAHPLTAQQAAIVRAAIQQIRVTIIPVFGHSWQDVARHVRRSKWDLYAIDHFHRFPGLGKVDAIDDALNGLLDAAAQSQAHQLLLCQLNAERSKDKTRPRPVARDLRGSQSLYYNPNNVVFVHREEEEQGESVTRGIDSEIWIDKARNGRQGPNVKVSLNPFRIRYETEREWRQRPSLEAVAA